MLDHVCLARVGAFARAWFAGIALAEDAPMAPTHEQVMQDGLGVAAMGSLMATTAKVRGLEDAVIDGAARDITETGSMLEALERYHRY